MVLRRSRRATTGFLADFRDFIMRGNVIDLAIAVIIGNAFGKIVSSLVEDLITPAILQPALKSAGVDRLSGLSVNGIQYGVFVAAVINFLVIAFLIFLLIRTFENAKQRLIREDEITAQATPDPAIVAQERLTTAVERLTDIIDSKI